MTEISADFRRRLKEKNLLIITPVFPSYDSSNIQGVFVKNQVAVLKNYFKTIFIICPVFRSLGIMSQDKFCEDYSYDNVHVYYPRCSYIPITWMSKILIDDRLKVVEKAIQKHELNFDLIHAHFTWPSGYIGVKLKEKLGIPVIATIHESGAWFDQELGMNHPLIDVAWSGADALIRVNSQDVPLLQRYNERVYSIPNGFSPSFHPIDPHNARDQLGIPENKKILFALGNLIPRKGFNFLIEAMEFVCSQRDDVCCYIGGAGPEKKNLQKLIDRLRLGEKIQLLGSISDRELPLWMNAAELFVLPSLDESFGIVQIEALACGKPVVSARNRGSEEVITSDEFGQLAEPADANDLGKKIIMALEKEWERDKIVGYAEQFTWEKVTDSIVDVYSEVLNRYHANADSISRTAIRSETLG